MRVLRHLPDVVMASGVIAGAIALGTGHRLVGATSILIAFLVAWKRDWCIESFEELMGSGDDTVDPDVSDDGDGHTP